MLFEYADCGGSRARARTRAELFMSRSWARALGGTRATVQARAWAKAGYVVGPEVMGDFI